MTELVLIKTFSVWKQIKFYFVILANIEKRNDGLIAKQKWNKISANNNIT